MEKIKIAIEGMEEEPIVLELNGFALVTFQEGIIKCLHNINYSDLSVASNVLQTECIKKLLIQS